MTTFVEAEAALVRAAEVAESLIQGTPTQDGRERVQRIAHRLWGLTAPLPIGPPSKTRATIDFLRVCQKARAAGGRVAYTTDPAWLVNQAINRRAGWVEDPHTRGTTQPVGGRFPRKAKGDWQRHLRLIAREVNTPRLVVRVARLGEHRWLADRLPERFEIEAS